MIVNRKVSMADVAPNRRHGGDIRALLTPTSVGSKAGFMGTVSLEPGESAAMHYHPYSDEFLFVVRGTFLLRIDGEEITADEGDAVYVRRGTDHRYENRSDSPALLVFQIAPLAPSPALGHVDVEPVPNPAEQPPSVGG